MTHDAAPLIDLSRVAETVSRKDFCQLTGIPPRSLNRLVALGWVRVWRPPGSTRARYLKVEIARLLAQEYDEATPRPPPAPRSPTV